MRRHLLAATVAAIGLAVSLPAAAIDLKISHQWKQGDGRDAAARVFTKEVSAKDPSVRFRIYPNRSLIAAPIEQLAALQDGSLDMAIYPIHYGSGRIPALSITMLPGLVRSIEHGDQLRDSPFAEALQKVAMDNGFRIVTWWWTPAGFVMRNRELRGPDSVAGLRIRGADAYVDMILRDNGASVQAMAGTEIYSAMQTGVLDGIVTSAESMVSYRMFEVGKFATIGGQYNFVTLLQPLLMSKAAWDKLSESQKAVFDQAARVSEAHFASLQAEADKDAIAAFTKAGVKVHALTEAEYKAWVAAAEKISWPAFKAKAPEGETLVRLATTKR